jgi:hypothetical protein
VPDPDDPQSLNRYSYVRNDPFGRIDPSGSFDFALFGGTYLIDSSWSRYGGIPIDIPGRLQVRFQINDWWIQNDFPWWIFTTVPAELAKAAAEGAKQGDLKRDLRQRQEASGGLGSQSPYTIDGLDTGAVGEALAPWEIVGLGRAAISAARRGGSAAASLFAAARGARAGYVAEAEHIRIIAEKMVGQGVDPAMAARWAVDARNALKLQARESLPRPGQWLAEQRNILRYGNPVGPSADDLLGVKTPAAVIESAGRTNRFLNWILGVE